MEVALLTPPRAPSTRLQIALLGPPVLSYAGQVLMLPRRQTRALLYRLAVALQPVPREQLCFLIWPDLPEASARRNLTVLLAQLRRILPAAALMTSGDAVALDPLSIHSDTATLAALLPGALREGQLERLANALQLYRGPFLEGFSLPGTGEFDTWAEQERQVWERRYRDALLTLMEGYRARGNYPAAIAAAQQLLASDELAEDIHRHLIVLYGAVGDRGAAVRQFKRCVAVLKRELGVEPLPETQAAYARVRDGHFARRSLYGA